MFKKLVSFVTGKVETAIEQNTSPEEAWRSAARILIKEIDRLQHTRVSAVQEIVKLKKKVKEHKDLHSGKESEIKKTSGGRAGSVQQSLRAGAATP